MSIVLQHIGLLIAGLGVTLELSLLGFVGAAVLGVALTVMRVGPVTPLRVFGTFYVEVFRNIPLLVFLYLFAFGLPDAGVSFSYFNTEAICLAMYFGAFACEAMRGGINAVPVGQAEAARALGMSFSQSLRLVILPQAFRTMIQPLANVLIGIVLGSSLGAAIGVTDLTGQVEIFNEQYDQSVPTVIVVAVLYAAVTLTIAFCAGRLQKRMVVRR